MHLPIDDHKEEFLRLVAQNQVVIVVGPPGCGKTTRIPMYLSEAGYRHIGVSEPRKLPAVELSNYIALQCGSVCGEKIGYQIRHDNRSGVLTEVKIMTEGISLKELQADPYLYAYDALMFDEVHEESEILILLLGFIKRVLEKRPEFRLIVSSASADSGKFSHYFENAPVMTVEGRLHNLKIIYEPLQRKSSYDIATARVVRRIHRNGNGGDILAFLPGEKDITLTANMIEEMDLDVEVCPLYGQQPPHEQAKALAHYGRRKVVLATNIAETSITIDGTDYVIDSGLIKQSDFDPGNGVHILEVVKHSKSGCIQRANRAGRTGDGECIRLYSEEDFESRPEYTTSEIRRSPASRTMLFLKGMGIVDVEKFPLLERPDRTHYRAAEDHLTMLGALSSKKEITPIGLKMLDLPILPHQVVQILESIKNNCAEAVITITGIISVGKNVFVRPLLDEFAQCEAILAKKRFTVPESDHLTYLTLYTKWQEAGGSSLPEEWYIENYVNRSVLETAEKNINQIIRILGSAYKPGSTDRIAIRKSIAAGLVDNVCKKVGNKQFQHVLSDNVVTLHPASVLQENAQLVVTEELFTTEREGGSIKACHCTAIKPEWLLGLAPSIVKCVGKTGGHTKSRSMKLTINGTIIGHVPVAV